MCFLSQRRLKTARCCVWGVVCFANRLKRGPYSSPLRDLKSLKHCVPLHFRVSPLLDNG